MVNFLKDNRQFVIIAFLWLVAGLVAAPAGIGMVVVTYALLGYKRRYRDLLLGLFYILILSDSFYLSFATTIKPVVLVLAAFVVVVNRKEFAPLNRLAIPFAFFFILSFFLLLNSPIPMNSAQKWLSYVLLFFTVPNYIVKLYQDEGEQVFRNIVFVGVLIFLAGFAMIIIDPKVTFSHGGRFRGIFGNPNGLGIFCTLFTALFTVLIHQYRNLFLGREKILVYGIIALAVMMSGSRNAIISIIILFLFLRLNKISPYINFVMLILIMVSYELIMLNIFDLLIGLGLGEYFRFETIEGGSGRLVAWEMAWQYISANFFLGKGFGYDEFIFHLPRNEFKLNMAGHQGGVHNVYLGMWLNTGLFGLLLYFGALVSSFMGAAKNSKVALPAFYAMLFLGNFEAWMIASLNPYTIQMVIMLTMMIYCLPKKEENEIA